MPNQLKQALSVIDKEIEFIFDREQSFLDVFGTKDYKCCEDSEGVWTDITKVSFSSDAVYFGYILDCGQHISDNIKIEDYIKWKECQQIITTEEQLINHVQLQVDKANAILDSIDQSQYVDDSGESPRFKELFKKIAEEAERISEASRKETWVVRVPDLKGENKDET